MEQVFHGQSCPQASSQASPSLQMALGPIAGRRPNKTKTEEDAEVAGNSLPHHEGQTKGSQEKVECLNPVTQMTDDINWMTRQNELKPKGEIDEKCDHYP